MNKKPRILVLEDDRTSRKLLVWILEKSGYEVIESSEGRDALHLAEMYPPKVVLVDVMLPDMRGTEVVEQLKKHPATRRVKSVFLTGILSKKAEDSDAQFSFRVDGLNYRALAKPVRKSVLLRLLREVIAESDAEEREHSQNVDSLGHSQSSSRPIRSASAIVEDETETDAIPQPPLWSA